MKKAPKKIPPLWVVEMLFDGEWEPTLGVALFRIEGRRLLNNWKGRNPDDKFRLRRYVRSEK